MEENQGQEIRKLNTNLKKIKADFKARTTKDFFKLRHAVRKARGLRRRT